MKTTEQILSGMRAALDARLNGIRTEAGEPIDDLLQTVAQDEARLSLLADYCVKSATRSGWDDILGDPTYQDTLAAAVGISSTARSESFVRDLGLAGVPSGIVPTDVAALLFRDLSRFASSFGVERRAATYGTGILRLTQPSADPVTVLSGGTVRSTSSTVLFDTMTDLIGVTPVLDPTTGRYYLEAAARCRTAGSVGNAARGAIGTLVSGLGSTVGVTNPAAFTGGRDIASNQELLNAFDTRDGVGTSIVTPGGLKRFVLAQANVIDALVLSAGDALLRRAAGGAVDVVVLGQNAKTAISTLRVLTDGETIVLPVQPVLSVTSVTDAGTPLSSGAAFDVLADVGVNAGSSRAVTSIQLHPAPSGGPTVGDDLTVVYQYDDLPRSVQRLLEQDPDRSALAGNVLIRRAEPVGLYLQMTLVPYPGIDANAAQSAVLVALQTYASTLRLGQMVAFSTLEVVIATAKVGGLPAVDRVDDLVVGISSTALAVRDVEVPGDQYLTLESVTFS